MDAEQLRSVRLFHRLVTQRAGALEDRFLGRDRPLGQSRVLYEVGRTGATQRELRSRLDLDSGYLSRLVGALVEGGLARLDPLPEDERITRVTLTDTGLRELDEIDRRSDEVAASLLRPLSEGQRDRLVASMDQVRRLLRYATLTVEPTNPLGPTARYCLERYFAELGQRFDEGFDPHLSVAPDLGDLAPPLGIFLVASVDGQPVACGAVKRLDERVGYIKRMWVDPAMRGVGMGRRMLAELETATADLGCTVVRLETNRTLSEAIALYRASGYVEIEPFNDERYADHWFEKRLAGS